MLQIAFCLPHFPFLKCQAGIGKYDKQKGMSKSLMPCFIEKAAIMLMARKQKLDPGFLFPLLHFFQ
ncbi:hypothetical protein NST70_03015 [Weizmannia sp. FSL K6-0777]|uniref:hypothetical protein n=1 Tax=Weizmannia sp. FSL K6-0777 TaxID=2954674 RepID=UPI0031595BD8